MDREKNGELFNTYHTTASNGISHEEKIAVSITQKARTLFNHRKFIMTANQRRVIANLVK
jgi:hypothetical protein